MEQPPFVFQASSWIAALIPILFVLIACVVIAVTPANHRERLLWGVPPPTESPTIRMAQLRQNTWRTLRWQSIVLGPCLAGVLGAIAAIGVVQVHMPVGVSIEVVGLVVVLSAIGLDVLGALFLLSRYISAAKRIRLDEEGRRNQS